MLIRIFNRFNFPWFHGSNWTGGIYLKWKLKPKGQRWPWKIVFIFCPPPPPKQVFCFLFFLDLPNIDFCWRAFKLATLVLGFPSLGWDFCFWIFPWPQGVEIWRLKDEFGEFVNTIFLGFFGYLGPEEDSFLDDFVNWVEKVNPFLSGRWVST